MTDDFLDEVSDHLYDKDGQGVTPSWSNNITPNLSPECGFDVTSTTYTVSLYHNPPPPPTDYATIVGPDEMKPGNTCHWYVSTNVGDPTIEWLANEDSVGTGSDLYYSASSSFTPWSA